MSAHSFVWTLLIMFATTLSAVETEPVQVQRVVDGDSIIVDATVGGRATGAAVRLRWIDTPERDQPGFAAANQALLELLPVGSRVTLWAPGDHFRLDGHGRILAIVRRADGTDAQTAMIAAGHSVYWRRYGAAPAPWDATFRQAQRSARRRAAGGWGQDPAAMRQQAAEEWRPAAGR